MAHTFNISIAESCRGGSQTEALSEPHVADFVKLFAHIVFADMGVKPANANLCMGFTALLQPERPQRCLIAVAGIRLDELGAEEFDEAYVVEVSSVRLADKKRIEVADIRKTEMTNAERPKLISEQNLVNGAKRLIAAIRKDAADHDNL